MIIHRMSLLAVAALSAAIAVAQDGGQRSSSSQYLQALAKPDVSLSFDVKAQGKRFQPTWGLDQAYISAQVLKKGQNHMGKENIGIGRTSFRVLNPLKNDTELTLEMIEGLQTRATYFDILDKELPLVLNCDNGYPDDYTGGRINTYYTSNKKANVDHWTAVIAAHVDWMKAKTKHPIIGISPFNEPDNALEKNDVGEIQGTADDEAKIAKALKEMPSMEGILIAGGNTLNDDNALKWFNSGKQYYDWGNTHQLAGSFDNFANFFQQLQKEGKVGYDDEMHNVAEAMVGLEYGMTVGIWWQFDSRARGEFCQISRHGERLAYGEHRNNWTAASVWRHDDGRVKAFVGGSERQSVTTNYQFVSTDREVYYDGYGPVREFLMKLPSGKSGDYMQAAQTNAERVIDVTWGDDVPIVPVTAGVYRLVNKNNSKVVAVSGDNIVLASYSKTDTKQQWNVAPAVSATCKYGGDFSFFDITSASNNAIHMNVADFSTVEANVMAYSKNEKADVNEQWYLEYAGDSFFYIRNRESAIYLAASGDNVIQTTMKASTTDINRLLWRIVPADVRPERIAPAKVNGLAAVAHAAAVSLSWDANADSDLAGYLVLRAEKGTNEWNTIGRMVAVNEYTDNTCHQGVTYIYKVKAVDLAQNRSRDASDEVEATPTGERSLVAHWKMEENVNDETANMMDAAVYGDVIYVDTEKTGKALRLQNNQYVQLPYEVASSDELTVAMWVQMRNSSTAWQRLFDFGNDTDHYLFLTPYNGNAVRFAIKNGGDEQYVDSKPRLPLGTWKHVVVTIGSDKTTIYIDGQESASTTGITIKPSDIRPVMNYIGRSQFVADPSLSAYVDDVRIYNYAVSAEDVKTIMEGGDLTTVQRPEVEPAMPVVYGLDGIRRDSPRKGLNIIDGKKVVR